MRMSVVFFLQQKTAYVLRISDWSSDVCSSDLIVTPSWDIITAGNWGGRWDMSVGSMTPTKKRAEVLDFPAVYYYTPAAFAVHKDSEIDSLADLNGKVIDRKSTRLNSSH